jgi:RNA polymerase sigma factor (sigma-70 family)
VEAVRRFDHRRGFRFATFALPWIRMRVAEVVATQAGRVGLPPGRAKAWRQAHARRMDLAAELGRNPTTEELARSWGRPVAWVEDLLAWRLPSPLPDSVSSDLVVEAEETPLNEYDLERLLRPVTGELRRVLRLRFGLGGGVAMSVSQVAAALGMSESTVRRREREAVELLRAELDLDALAA